MLILAYAALMLSRWDEGCVGSRVAVTFSGVISVGMAIAASYGFCSYIGLFFSPLMNVLPFLLLGIGVDDMFVIVNQYDHMDPTLDPATRVGKALASAGASILVTSATDVFAFLIGECPLIFGYFWLFLVIFGYFWQFPYGKLVTDAVFCLPSTAIFPRARRRHQVPRDPPQPRVGRHRAIRQAAFRVRVGRHHVPAAPAHRASSRHAGYNRVDVFAI